MMTEQKTTPTMQTLADALGLSKSTISLAMRDDPRIHQHTRERVHAAADRLGYRVRPELCRLMACLRLGTRKTDLLPVALVVPAGTEATTEFRHGFDERLAVSGYHAELFRLGDVSAERLASILKARGIEAALVVASVSATEILAISGQYCVRLAGKPETREQGFVAGVLLAEVLAYHRTGVLVFS
jgi:LacI family transcriptional regulator